MVQILVPDMSNDDYHGDRDAVLARPRKRFWFPLAFDRPYSLIDYLDEDTMLLIVARERIESIAETIRKEYATMYRLALRDTLVPPTALIKLELCRSDN